MIPRPSGARSWRSPGRWSARSAAPTGSPRSGSPTNGKRRSSGTGVREKPVPDPTGGQSRTPAPACDRLREAGHEPLFRERTGLPLDAYFSGPKIAHIPESGEGLRSRATRGELAFGTVDSFLLWQLTGGRVHATDVSNASRTLLFDIHTLAWDEELLALFGVPGPSRPEATPSSFVLGQTEASEFFGASVPVAGVAGDQQAALFGQGCYEPGM